jgi:hypothetical protein
MRDLPWLKKDRHCEVDIPAAAVEAVEIGNSVELGKSVELVLAHCPDTAMRPSAA